jgi:hypothetical protein
MTATARILPRAPIIAARGFGLIDSAWPLRRQRRPARSAEARRARVERHFRRERASSLAHATASPALTHLVVTNLTLSPRFSLIWQDWSQGVERLRQLERETSRDNWRHVLQIRWRPALARMRGARLAPRELLVERASAVFAERILSSNVVWRLKPLPSDSSLFTGGQLRDVSPGRIERHLSQSSSVGIQETQFPRRWPTFATNRAQTAFRSTELRLLQALTTTVTQRSMRVLCEEMGEQFPKRSPLAAEPWVQPRVTHPERLPAVEVPAPRQFAPAPSETPRPPGREVSRVGRVLRSERSDAPRLTGRADVPAERVFRAEGAVAPPASHSPVTATPVPVPQSPQIDIAKLDTVQWQRFEKRLSIERERRGRG